MIPFLSRLQKGKAKPKPAKAKVMPRPLEKKSGGERMSKTVMPSATRTVAPQDPFALASQSATNGGVKVAPRPAVAFAPAPRELPPAVALALEPRVERVISVELADVFNQLPVDFLKPRETIDTTRRILLKAAEVEKGMANGKPAVSLASVYQQIPEIFSREIPPSEPMQVQLPFAKVLEQFASLQVRPDQLRARAVPHVETPFLQVTREDDSRFGTTQNEPVESGDFSPIRMEAPTAQAFAAAEPEAAAAELYHAPAPQITEPAAEEFADNTPAPEPAPAPTRIPFNLSPQGTDALRDHGVPAAAPAPSVLSGVAEAPKRIPFKMTPPADELRGKTDWLTAESLAATQGPKISLPLKSILESLPAFQLNGDPQTVPNELSIDLPFAEIQPQLAKGRVAIAPEVLQLAIPENFRGIFNASQTGSEVLLPLQQVLKNLPTQALRMRDDQEEQAAGANYATTFSVAAQEDAKRFDVSGAVAKAPPEPRNKNGSFSSMPETISEPSAVEQATPLAATSQFIPTKSSTEENVDPKAILADVNAMPGIQGSAILFGDGLSLAGKFPEHFHSDALLAMAPSMLQRIEQHMAETRLGNLESVTLSCAERAVTIFQNSNLYLAIIHQDELGREIRPKLARIVHELSQKYSQQPVRGA